MTSPNGNCADEPTVSLVSMLQAQHEHTPHDPEQDMRILAQRIARTMRDLPGALEKLAGSVGQRNPDDVVNEILSLEQQQPSAFYAGALAGMALGQHGTPASGPDEAHDQAASSVDAGVVSAPADSHHTGAGGLGYIEPATGGHELPARRKE